MMCWCFDLFLNYLRAFYSFFVLFPIDKVHVNVYFSAALTYQPVGTGETGS